MGDRIVYTKETFMERVRHDLRQKELDKREAFYQARREYMCDSATALIIDRVRDQKAAAYKKNQSNLKQGAKVYGR